MFGALVSGPQKILASIVDSKRLQIFAVNEYFNVMIALLAYYLPLTQAKEKELPRAVAIDCFEIIRVSPGRKLDAHWTFA